MTGHEYPLGDHHILWIKKLWRVRPYNQLRNHPHMRIHLDPQFHADLHAKFTWNPMPLPPMAIVDELVQALNKGHDPMSALDSLIAALEGPFIIKDKSNRPLALTHEDEVRIENLRYSLMDQRAFLLTQKTPE